MTTVGEEELQNIRDSNGELVIFDKLEDTEVSRDSGLGDNSEPSEDFDLSEYLEAAWKEEVGLDQFPLCSGNQYDQPSCPPSTPRQQYRENDVLTAENSEDTQTTEKDTEAGGNDDNDHRKDQSRENLDDFEETDESEEREESVPPGWELSYPGDSLIILSPTGERYQSRREAFQALCRQDSSLEERAAMFDCLAWEDFRADEMLPLGWIFRPTGTGVNFLNSEGHFISSISEAETHFRAHLSSERYEMFQHFIQSFSSDQTFLPAGWRLEEGLVKSPAGVVFSSRLEALQFLVQSGAEREEVELVRSGLQLDGWAHHDLLPLQWRFRILATRPQFVSREGQLLDSSEAAVNFLAANCPPYQDVDVERVESFTSQVVAGYEEDCDDAPSQPAQPQPELPPSGERGDSCEYGEDRSVPPGWKLRLDGCRGLLSPGGLSYRSRRQAYQDLIRRAAPHQQIEAMRSCLKYEDWTDNSELPEGWKSRPTTTATHYMNPGGQVFKSAVQASRFLQEHAELFTAEDLEKIKKLSRRREGKSEPEWNSSDSSVPAGWSSRLAGRRKLLRDDRGNVYRSVRAALESVVTRGDQETTVRTLRDCLERDGWRRVNSLQDHWLYKQQSAYVLHFITPTGEALVGKSKALAYLANRGELTEAARSAFSLIRAEVESRETERKAQPSWSYGDLSVPEGWGTAENVRRDGSSSSSSSTLLISPQGKLFKTRREAVEFLFENDRQLEAEKLRESLSLEGWRSDPLLPPDWQLQFPSQQPLLCTEQGKLLRGFYSPSRTLEAGEQNLAWFAQFSLECLPRELGRIFQANLGQEERQRRLEALGWFSREFLPPGWLQGRDEARVLSPAGTLFLSVGRHPANQGRREGRGKSVRGGKPRAGAGWLENEFLPAGWRCRQTRANSSCILVLSPEGEQFSSYRAVLEHLRSDGRYSREDAERFQRFPDGVLRRVTARGSSVRKYQAALRREREDPGEVEEVRAGLREGGWREDSDLVPTGWMFRQRPGLASMEFINQAGRQFHSVKEANSFLALNKVDFLIRGSLCQAAVVDNYELELKRIERRTNLEKPAQPALPSLPAGISLSRLKAPATAPAALNKHSQKVSFSLENFNPDSSSISEFQNVFKQLETFKKKNCNVRDNKRFKSSFDEIDRL